MNKIYFIIFLTFSFLLFAKSDEKSAVKISEEEQNKLMSLMEETPFDYFLKGTVKKGETQILDFKVNTCKTLNLLTQANETELKLKLKGPDGKIIDGFTNQLPTGVIFKNLGDGIFYHLTNPQKGNWQAIVEGVTTQENGSEFYIGYGNDIPFSVHDTSAFPVSEPGDPVQLGVVVGYKRAPCIGADVIAKITTDKITTPEIIKLYDDGTHGDENKNDGIYGEKVIKKEACKYYVEYIAKYTLPNGESIEKSDGGGFTIKGPSGVEVIRIFNDRLNGDRPPYNGLDVDIEVKTIAKPMTLTAMLVDLNDKEVTRANTEFTGNGNNMVVTVHFEGEDFEGKPDGPYEVGDILIQNIHEMEMYCSSDKKFKTQFYKASDFKVKDSDGDGLSDEQERKSKTDLTLPDTDNDGLTDYQEVQMKTNPLNPDTDGDGHLDGQDAFPLDPKKWET